MEDKYLWLEDISGAESLEWVRAENTRTKDVFNSESWFQDDVKSILEILESKEKIPMVSFIDGGFVYNHWTDDVKVQGLLRRATIESYKNNTPDWDIILDFDLMSEKDKQKWVYHGITISPNKKRALVYISPGGTDADVMREFDFESRKFVEDGFLLPVAKGGADWLSDDELFLYRVLGPETVTSAGYAKLVKRWKRGEALDAAVTIFEIASSDNGVSMDSYFLDGKSSYLATKSIDFYTTELYRFVGSEFKKLNLPKKFDFIGKNLNGCFMTIGEAWLDFSIGDVVFHSYETQQTELLYHPEKNSSVYSGRVLKDGMLLIVDTDVKSSLYYLNNEQGKWTSKKLALPENGSIDWLNATSKGNDFFVAFDSYNTPLTYYYGKKDKIESVVRTQPSYFNHQDIEVSQHFVTSPDGTKVPYFLAHKKGTKYDGTNPTILYGYGGFEISLKAHFSNAIGKLWLDKGGVYALANIRGGGEYGPAWHQAALKGNRQRAYDDFYAVAEDLIARKITTPEHLGAHGGSNGGLLMGVCYTQRPDLFAAINCGVPLLDMRRYHKLLAGYSWIAEYGNPDDEIDGAFIRALSPYHKINKEQKNYPMMYLNTSTKDDRVHPGHARKFGALIKEYGFDYLYHENIDGGHAGASNSKELAFMMAMNYAFFWKYLK